MPEERLPVRRPQPHGGLPAFDSIAETPYPYKIQLYPQKGIAPRQIISFRLIGMIFSVRIKNAIKRIHYTSYTVFHAQLR